jgi:mannose-6-phosphate isomerase-like protein (cupin superfamily)
MPMPPSNSDKLINGINEEVRGRRAHLRAADALAKLESARDKRFITLFEHGTLQMEFYAPRGHDPQQPHSRDEVYVVVEGSGTYFDGAERRPCGMGDLLFAPAGTAHRFEEFTHDFAVWVLFYGPEGGETP